MVANTALAFSMSADAFAVSLCKGVALKRPRPVYAFRVGMIFGSIEALTPVIGWAVGMVAGKFIASIDHWVAFVILAGIGSKMIHESLGGKEEEKCEVHKPHRLVLTAIGTSIDSMAVGVTLGLIEVNIWIIAAMIGVATCLMTTIGILAGHYVGLKAGRIAELLGGVCLIAIGTKILCEHMGWVA